MIRIANILDQMGSYHLADVITHVAISKQDLLKFYGTRLDASQYMASSDDEAFNEWRFLLLNMRDDLVKDAVIQIKGELENLYMNLDVGGDPTRYVKRGYYNSDEEFQNALQIEIDKNNMIQNKSHQIKQELYNALELLGRSGEEITEDSQRQSIIQGLHSASQLFLEDEMFWGSEYGGKPWADIANATANLLLIKLPNTQGNTLENMPPNRRQRVLEAYGKLEYSIDHLIDLAHNTDDFVLGFTSGESIWIKDFLDNKSASPEGVIYHDPSQGALNNPEKKGRANTEITDKVDNINGVTAQIILQIDNLFDKIISSTHVELVDVHPDDARETMIDVARNHIVNSLEKMQPIFIKMGITAINNKAKMMLRDDSKSRDVALTQAFIEFKSKLRLRFHNFVEDTSEGYNHSWLYNEFRPQIKEFLQHVSELIGTILGISEI